MPAGFILHPTYYIERGPRHRPPVRSRTRRPVVRHPRRPYRPHFFIRTEDMKRAGSAEARDGRDRLTTPHGRAVTKVFVPTPPEAPALRDALQDAGVFPTYEADIPFATSYLIQHRIRGAVQIEGEARAGKLIQRVYQNPELSPADFAPELSVLSVDIETDPSATHLLSIGLHQPARGDAPEVREVLILGPAPEVEGIHVIGCDTEGDLCFKFTERLRALDPDILTGWNFIDFDLKVLEDVFTRNRVPFQLGRANLPCKLRLETGAAWGSSRAIVPGRVVLDALNVVRDSFIKLDDYRLETAGRQILGRGKTMTGQSRGEEILRKFKEEREEFVRYNLVDCELVSEIIQAKRLISLSVRRSLVSGMPLDRLGASIATFDFCYISEMHARKQVAPTVPQGRISAAMQGGFVFDPTPGIYRQVGVLDFKSLYPSIIRTFRLDPLRVVPRGEDPTDGEEPIPAPNGVRFARTGGILPDLLDEFFPLREEAKKSGDSLRSQALKILMNSFYGVLGTTRCRFYSPETANAITGFGQKILRWTQGVLEREGHAVLYGDTDSLFVDLGNEPTRERAEARARELAYEINLRLKARLESDYAVESRLEIEFEHVYSRLFLPALRHSTQGSKKRYVGLIDENGKERLHFVGLESVRRDWTDLAKDYQKELVDRIFHDRPVEDYTRDFVDALRTGHYDTQLVYKKQLRKSAEEYTSTTPPHVQAARKMSGPPPRVIHYVFTIDGPEPADERKHAFDYEHYVEKQVRPIAESVFSLVGLDWERVTGVQGTLF
ncbi:MAG: DNA polymerase II [Candidatus Eisenbacteria bacterium]